MIRPPEFNHMLACFTLNENSIIMMVNRLHTALEFPTAEQKRDVLLAMMGQFTKQMNAQNFQVVSISAHVTETLFAWEYDLGATSEPYKDEFHKCGMWNLQIRYFGTYPKTDT